MRLIFVVAAAASRLAQPRIPSFILGSLDHFLCLSFSRNDFLQKGYLCLQITFALQVLTSIRTRTPRKRRRKWNPAVKRRSFDRKRARKIHEHDLIFFTVLKAAERI
jgi:hypothetical protein